MMARNQPRPKSKTIPPKTGKAHPDESGSKLLTPAQARALITWHRLFERNGGEEPTVREVAEELEMTANGAHALLIACDHAGAFSREPVEVPGPRKLTAYGRKWLTLA